MMKHSLWILLAVLPLAGCTTVKYEAKSTAGAAKPADYPIYVYSERMKIPRAFETLGSLRIGDTPLTVMGGSLEGVLKTLRQYARQKGADAVQLTSVEAPGFTSSNYRVEANLIRFTDVWESVRVSDAELAAYYANNAGSLDPIEGIWQGSDPTRSRVAVVKDSSKPGREFVAFVLGKRNPTWQRGDKLLELARGEREGVYRGNYYLDDYQVKRVAITLRGPPVNRFGFTLPNDTTPIVFAKE
ncbi:MAG: hypothetical protein KJ070_07620 [Verrucomicrobia bacterium]|nr:hypothetical protein [Verrucomicrobiota bacterium]